MNYISWIHEFCNYDIHYITKQESKGPVGIIIKLVDQAKTENQETIIFWLVMRNHDYSLILIYCYGFCVEMGHVGLKGAKRAGASNPTKKLAHRVERLGLPSVKFYDLLKWA